MSDQPNPYASPRAVAIAAEAPVADRIGFIQRTYGHLFASIAVFVALEFLLFSIPGIDGLVRTMLGDIDGALGIAAALQGQGEIFEMDLLFIPETAPLRADPGFAELTESLGLTDYWSRTGCKWTSTGLQCSAG